MFKISKNIQVFVPKANNQGQAIQGSALDRLNQTKKNVTAIAGGFTEWDVRGGWLEDGKLYQDEITLVEFGYNDTEWDFTDTADFIDAVIEMVNATMEGLEQLAVSVKVNGTLLIIDNDDSRDDILQELIELV